MFVDDGSWASRLNLKDKAQGTAQDFISIIKATRIDSEMQETLADTAKQFSLLDNNMKSTRQNIVKLSQVLNQVQEANYNLLDNFRATEQACQSLQLPPPPNRE